MKVELVISMDENGAVSVNGPIENMILCLGLMEVAKESIIEYSKQAAKKVQPVTTSEFAAMRERLAVK